MTRDPRHSSRKYLFRILTAAVPLQSGYFRGGGWAA